MYDDSECFYPYEREVFAIFDETFFNVFDTESYDIGSLTYGCLMIE